MISYWPFDDNTADPTLDDVVANANDGTLGTSAGADADDPTYNCDAADIAPVDGNVCSLDFAVDELVRVPDDATLEPTDVTVSVWVRANGTPGTFDYILAKTLDGCKASYALYTRNDGGLWFYASSAASCGSFFLSAPAGPGIWDDKWHHIAGVYDSFAQTVQLFVDGAEIGTPNTGPAAIDYTTASGFGDLTIGSYNIEPIADWDGNIDEVRVYGRVLSDEEIEELASGGHAATGADINIHPTSFPNPVNVCTSGMGASTPVVIWGSDSFDVAEVDLLTLMLGTNELKTKGMTPNCSVADVGTPDDNATGVPCDGTDMACDGALWVEFSGMDAEDGDDDLTCHFYTKQLTDEVDFDGSTFSLPVTGISCPNGIIDGVTGLYNCDAGTQTIFAFSDEIKLNKKCLAAVEALP